MKWLNPTNRKVVLTLTGVMLEQRHARQEKWKESFGRGWKSQGEGCRQTLKADEDQLERF